MLFHLLLLSLFIFVQYTESRPSISRHLAPGLGPLEKMFTASNGKNPLLAATYYFNPSGLLEDSSLSDGSNDNAPFSENSPAKSKQADRQLNSRTRNGHHLKIHASNTNDLASNNDLNSYADESESNNQQNLNELNELGSGYCISADDRKGICYNSNECTNRGGIPMGSCGDANSTPGSPRGAVCCIFEVTCGDESSEPLVYIQNPDYPRATTKGRSNMCRIKIGKTNKNAICQFKVNMVNFNIAPPLLGGGNCSNDVFVITGQNENNILPKICGYNDGQHYYFAVDESGVITFNFMLNYNHYYFERKFNMQLTQIPCSVDKLKAPPNCLQYLTGTYGALKSFNYQVSSASSHARGRNNVNSDQSNSVITGYPNDLDYSICFKKEPGFCSITYELANTNDGHLSPFEIGTSESLTGHRIVSSFAHHSLSHSQLTSRSSNREASKFSVLANNHHNVNVNSSQSTSGTNQSSSGASSSSLSNHLSPATVSLSPSTTVIASQCTEDYLIVGGGIRLCSASIPYLPLSSVSSIGDASSSSSTDVTVAGSIGKVDLQANHLLTSNATSSVILYTDSTSGPFTLRFVSNSLGSARGFNLIFRQNPCN